MSTIQYEALRGGRSAALVWRGAVRSTFSCVSAQRHEVGLPSLRGLLSLNAPARGGIFYFLLMICYNIFLFSGLF
jgi:hypothetical protein